ncbi:MAG: RecX family transcriptional regulator, partial [Caldilineaceae bacterium]|nr:RecX family transcriptional regulator [Caldilineaceae bacterium]
GTITRLQIQKKNKERVNVYVNGEYAFSLALSLAMGLKKGQELSAAEVKTLQADDEVKLAYAAALNLLGYRARSITEVAQRLEQREFSEQAITQTTERLLREGYLNDTSFGQAWIESRQRSSPRSERALRYELRRKGVEPEVIDEVLEHVEIDEEGAAWTALEPKLDRWHDLESFSFRQKAGSFLARRGFGHDVVRPVLERAWAAMHAADEEE